MEPAVPLGLSACRPWATKRLQVTTSRGEAALARLKDQRQAAGARSPHFRPAIPHPARPLIVSHLATDDPSHGEKS